MARIPPPPNTGSADSGRRLVANDDSDDARTDCGPECRNRLHELDHPKEEERCAAGQVLDIWGYCRYLQYNTIQHNVKTISTWNAVFSKCHNTHSTCFDRQEHFPRGEARLGLVEERQGVQSQWRKLLVIIITSPSPLIVNSLIIWCVRYNTYRPTAYEED